MRTLRNIVTGVLLSAAFCSATAQTTKHKQGRDHHQKIQKELGLSQEQSSQMEAIHTKYSTQIQAIRQDQSLTKEAIKAQVEPLIKAKDAEVKNILTPQQYTALNQIKSKHQKGGKHKEWMQALNLTEQQEQQMKSIKDKYRPQMMAIKQDSSLDQAAKKTKLKPLKKAQMLETKKILTKEQFKTYRNLQKKGPRNLAK